MQNFRVFIATTAGPRGVLSLSQEDPEVHSVICIDGSEQDLPISPAYHRFVKEPTGIIERAFRHPAWRMDVDGPIDTGNSWKLGVLTAHALAAAGRLAPCTDESATALWLTGDVTRDLSVRAVGHIPRKFAMSADLFARLREAGTEVRLFLPAVDYEPAEHPEPDLASLPVACADDVLEAIGLPALASRPDSRSARPPSAKPDGAGLDFTAFLREKSRDFVGRQWLLDDIEAWCNGPQPEPALLVLGDPGSGKSALSARLSKGDTVIATHFCQSDAQATLDAGRFVQSVAHAVRDVLPPASNTLAATAEFLTNEACRMDPASAMDFGLIPLLSEYPMADRRAVIVVDGLDESLNAGARLTIAELLATRLERLPRNVAIVATSRNDPRVHRQFPTTRHVQIQSLDERNLADLRAFVAQRLGSDSADWVCRWAEGNFLYARQVLDSVERGNDILAGGGDMPRGLEGLYLRLFNRHWPQGAGFAEAHDVLAIILAAREPLTAGQIGNIHRCAGGAPVHAVLEKLGPFLKSSDQRLEVFHTSLADWLTRQDGAAGPFSVSRQAGETALTEWCLAWADHEDIYALRHTSAHLRATGQTDRLADLVQNRRYLAMQEKAAMGELGRWTDLVAYFGALLHDHRDAEAVDFAVDPAVERGAALTASAIDLNEPLRVQGIARRLLDSRAETQLARINAVRAGVNLAARIGDADALARLTSDRDPTVRAALVVGTYTFWRRSDEAGWKLLKSLGERLFSRMGIPDQRIVDVLGGVSLAIVARHLDDENSMSRLHALWRDVMRRGLALPAARLVGRSWVTALAVPSLRILLSRQPNYQPLNIAEIDGAVRLSADHSDLRARAIDLIEAPRGDLAGLEQDLTAPDLEFDIVHVLAAERALIVASKGRPEEVFDLLDSLARNGRPWFRQSVLYAGFHIVSVAESGERLLDRYLALSRDILASDRGLYQTPQGKYQMVPHFAWPEVLRLRLTGDTSANELQRHGQSALQNGDEDLAIRIAGAAEILSLGYGLHAVALNALTPFLGRTEPDLATAVRQALANIRFHATSEVDRFLRENANEELAQQISATVPTVSAADYPTWIDALFVRNLTANPAFCDQVAQAFRQAARAKHSRQLLAHVVPWVAGLLAD